MAKRGTELQYKIIDLLVEGKKRKEVAEIAGCDIQTVDRIKADPDLRQRYYERCQEAIQDLVPLAIYRLRELLRDDKTQGSVHVAATREVLDRTHLREILENTNKEIKIVVSYE